MRTIGLVKRIDYDLVTGCWNWKGTKVPSGYGVGCYKGKKIYAHRLSALLWLRFDQSSGLQVLHRCDNPSCFNPAHLFIGTQSENLYDAVRKGRHTEASKTHCPNGHPYDILVMERGVNPHRRCSICKNAGERLRWRQKKKHQHTS